MKGVGMHNDSEEPHEAPPREPLYVCTLAPGTFDPRERPEHPFYLADFALFDDFTAMPPLGQSVTVIQPYADRHDIVAVTTATVFHVDVWWQQVFLGLEPWAWQDRPPRDSRRSSAPTPTPPFPF